MTAPAPAASLRRQPRIGFLGLGWIGRHRMQAVLEAGDATVAALADAAEAARGEAATLAPEATTAETLEDLLDADLDGIVIATPSALHAAQSLKALDAGLAVFCQKPVGRTAAEVHAVVDAAERADRLLGVDMCYRHCAATQPIAAAIQAGELGRVFAADLTFHNAYGPDKPWYYDRNLSGGGCLIDLGVHLVDLALWALGFPRVVQVSGRLFADGEMLARGTDAVEDYAIATLVTEAGTAIRIACSWNLAAGQDAVIEAAFYGTSGGMAMRNPGGGYYDFETARMTGTARETIVRPPDAWGGRPVVEWAQRLARGEGFDAEARSLVTVAEIFDRIYGRLTSP